MNQLIKKFSVCLLIATGILFGCSCQQKKSGLKILVITGGHGYDTLEFAHMFESLPGLICTFAEKPAAWKMLDDKPGFRVLVFYDMYQPIVEEEKAIFLHEFEKGTGMVFLHHSLGSHQGWPEYRKLIGGTFYSTDAYKGTPQAMSYEHDLSLGVQILDRDHPVTQGVDDYTVVDEGYGNTIREPGNHYLLETDHPSCDSLIGWARTSMNSRVVYFMGGHDKKAYAQPAFRKLLENAIHWTAR